MCHDVPRAFDVELATGVDRHQLVDDILDDPAHVASLAVDAHETAETGTREVAEVDQHPREPTHGVLDSRGRRAFPRRKIRLAATTCADMAMVLTGLLRSWPTDA